MIREALTGSVECGLLLSPLPKAPYTTNSQYNFPVFHNIFLKIELEYLNRTGITYIQTDRCLIFKPDYRCFFTKNYRISHRKTLDSKERLKPLEMALNTI